METKNWNIKVARVILAAVFSFLQYYFVYKYTYSFNFMQIWGETYYLPLIISCAGLFVISILLHKRFFLYNGFDIITLTVLSIYLLLLLTETGTYNFDNEVFCNQITFLCLFISLRMTGRDFIRSIVYPVILIFFLFELSLGYSTLTTHKFDHNLNLLIVGHLENSGIYSIYLVCHLPLIRFYSEKIIPSRKISNIIIAVLHTAVGVLLVFTGSRAAICGVLLYFLVQGFYGRFLLYRKSVKITIIIGIVGLTTGLLFLKPLSVLGRLNIWKVTLMHAPEYFWTGVGYGQFHRFYPQWQIEYFSTLPTNRISEVSFADEVYVAYNEFLQLFVEVGLWIFLGLAFLFILLLLKTRLQDDGLLKPIRRIFLIVSAACLFSYPLHVNVIMVLLTASIAYCISGIKENIKIPHTVYLRLILTGCLLIVILKSIKAFSNIAKWQETAGDVFLSDSVRLKRYENLYPVFKNNAKFLLDYGIFLYLLRNPQSVKVLIESRNLTVTSATLQTLAQAYEVEGKLDKAIPEWTKLSYLTPNRFSYKNKLMDLYVIIGDTLSAKKIAKLIIAMPVKKNDQPTQFVKAKAERFLRTH